MATRQALYLSSVGYAMTDGANDSLAAAGLVAGAVAAPKDMTFQMYGAGPSPRIVDFTTAGGATTLLYLNGAQIALTNLSDGAGVVSTPVPDNTKLNFGTDSDGWIKYDEAGGDTLEIETKAIAGGASSGIIITTGNTSISGNSGDIEIGSGTAAGTRGKVKLTSDMDSQANNVIMSGGTLDVPAGVNFKIGTSALTTANWTAGNVDDLLDGSPADSLHKHWSTFMTGQTTAGLATAGEIGYVSGASTWGLAVCSGTLLQATCEGTYVAASVIRTDRAMSVYFVAGLVPAPAECDPVYVSAVAGQATNVIPTTVGHYVSHIGTVLSSTYGADRKAVVLFRPATPVLIS